MTRKEEGAITASSFLLTFGVFSVMICPNAEVAQSVEHLTRNEKAVSSSLIFSSKARLFSS